MENEKTLPTPEQVKQFADDCQKAVDLIYDLVDQKKVPPPVMAQACLFCFKMLSMSLNISHKEYAKQLDYHKKNYKKELKEFNKAP